MGSNEIPVGDNGGPEIDPSQRPEGMSEERYIWLMKEPLGIYLRQELARADLREQEVLQRAADSSE